MTSENSANRVKRLVDVGSDLNSPQVEAAVVKKSDNPAPLLADLKDGLLHQDGDRVRSTFDRIAASPVDLDLLFDDMRAIFSELECDDFLVDLILARTPETLSRMRLIEKALLVGVDTQREGEVFNAIRALGKAPNGRVVSWEAATRMAFGRRYGKKIMRDLMEVKYLGVSRDPERLMEAAEVLADRIELPKPMLDRLHAHTRYPDMPRVQWEQRVRTAFAIDHVTKDHLAMSDPNLGTWLGQKDDAVGAMRRQVDEKLQGVDRSKGVLMATFHGGFSRLTISLFQHLFSNGVTVLGGASKPKATDGSRYIRVVGNERGALFQALRAVQDGRPLWIGADAPFGNSKQAIEVLGVTVPVADGAPFIAFETRCPTLWLALVRSGAGFSIVTAMGPVRMAGEKYQAFKDRWFSFYRTCIEDFLTGDPGSLALRPHWMQYLGGDVFQAAHSAKPAVAPIRRHPTGGAMVKERTEVARAIFDWI